MVLNENDYPMTYKEYEKRVIELFLEMYEGENLKLMEKRIADELENNPNYTVEDEIYEYSDDEKPYIKLFVRNDVSILYKQTKNSEK